MVWAGKQVSAEPLNNANKLLNMASSPMPTKRKHLVELLNY